MRNLTTRRPAESVFANRNTMTRAHALRDLGQVLYAVRMSDSTIKIGCTRNLAERLRHLGGELLAFKAGDFDEELDLHHSLSGSTRRGREWYAPTADVMAVVNEWRRALRLPVAS